ncbi:MAG: FAD-dependent oxidoreductase, partial [Vicinamibacteria bacterium]
MTTVIPPLLAPPEHERVSRIQTRLPDLEHWKAQVKCQSGCPVATDAGRYVQLIALGRDEDAFLVARAPNPFASVCGRVCAAPCEDACRRGAIDAPIAIRALKRYVTERYGVESVRPDTQDRLREASVAEGNCYVGHLPIHPSSHARPEASARRKVAVVGAGPSGMSAAHDLALLGYDVTVFEAAAEPGGMMRFGIPEYRLPRTLIRAEIDKIVSLGVTLKLGTPLSASLGLAELKQQGFESVFLSVGVAKGRELDVPGVELDGVVKAVDYLLNVNQGYRMNLGRHVVVIGGGFVAFDAARTALRLGRDDAVDLEALASETDARAKEALDSARAALRGGATEVTIVSLERFDEMPVLRTTQGHDEFEETKREGIAFLPRRGPMRFLGEGRLKAVSLRRVLSVFDADGRFAPRYDDEDLVTLDADSCILAIGQKPDLAFLRPSDGVTLNPSGTIRVDPVTLATSAPGIFAGGDVAFGPR